MPDNPTAIVTHGPREKKAPNDFDEWTPLPDTQNQYENAASVNVPAVPKYDPGAKASNKVDSAALRKFADNLEQLMTTVSRGRDSMMKGLRVPAGGFPHAVQLSENILGTGESKLVSNFSNGTVPVVPGTGSFLDSALNALVKLQTSTRGVADIFEKTEDLNESQAKQLEELLNSAGQYLGGAAGTSLTATNLTDPTGGAGTGGTGTGGTGTGGAGAG